MKPIPLLLMILFLCSAMIHAADLPLTGDIQNVHDPVVIKCGPRYYLFCTGAGIPIHVSDDLKQWKRAGQVFEQIPAWAKERVPGSRDIWAPDISYRSGRYYLYYSVSTFGKNGSVIGLATNATLDPASPDYKWKDEGLVIESVPGRDDWNAIDAQGLTDANGTPYLVFGSYWSGLKLVALDPATGKPKSERPELTTLATRPVAKAVEAPYLVHHDGFYYLFVSHDFCCRGVDSTYKVRVGRSRKITGPYLDAAGKKLTEDGGTPVVSGETRWRGPGHNSVLQEGNKTYLVYHAYDADNRGARTLRISELRWQRNGWPTLDRAPSPMPSTPAAGYWEHTPGEDATIMIHLLPDGKINKADSADTWTLVGKTLTLRWENASAPGGAWIDRVELSADRRTYRGTNQNGKRIQGVRVSAE